MSIYKEGRTTLSISMAFEEGDIEYEVLCDDDRNGELEGDSVGCYLRPVIILTDEIQKNGFSSGTGIKDDPYILN